MRTTINLPDELLARLKKDAVESGTTLTQLIENALRECLARKNSSRTRPHAIELPTFGSGGVQPGIDLDDSASLIELMDLEAGPDTYGR